MRAPQPKKSINPLKKDDTVIVPHRQVQRPDGKVVATHPAENKVTVEGIISSRRRQAKQSPPTGAIVELTKPIG